MKENTEEINRLAYRVEINLYFQANPPSHN